VFAGQITGFSEGLWRRARSVYPEEGPPAGTPPPPDISHARKVREGGAAEATETQAAWQKAGAHLPAIAVFAQQQRQGRCSPPPPPRRWWPGGGPLSLRPQASWWPRQSASGPEPPPSGCRRRAAPAARPRAPSHTRRQAAASDPPPRPTTARGSARGPFCPGPETSRRARPRPPRRFQAMGPAVLRLAAYPAPAAPRPRRRASAWGRAGSARNTFPPTAAGACAALASQRWPQRRGPGPARPLTLSGGPWRPPCSRQRPGALRPVWQVGNGPVRPGNQVHHQGEERQFLAQPRGRFKAGLTPAGQGGKAMGAVTGPVQAAITRIGGGGRSAGGRRRPGGEMAGNLGISVPASKQAAARLLGAPRNVRCTDLCRSEPGSCSRADQRLTRPAQIVMAAAPWIGAWSRGKIQYARHAGPST